MSNFDLRKYLAEGRLLKEVGMEASFLPVDPIPGTTELTSDIFNSIKNKLITSGEKIINKIPKDQLMAMKSSVEKVMGPSFDKEDITIDNAEKVGKILMSQLNENSSFTEGVPVEPNFADAIANILVTIGGGALITSPLFASTGVIAIGGLIAMVVAFIIGGVFGDKSYARSQRDGY
jgi:hypothetical protein